ncbi:hypothetical protein [Brevundimonas aveniformis]|uniref:hypothetical protein n=1 Tax=Brevundimonas aveniformis TaxID=370977 RepID=UPI0003F6919D|nr:hypothetical protein [Brevundimonas aveniformis]
MAFPKAPVLVAARGGFVVARTCKWRGPDLAAVSVLLFRTVARRDRLDHIPCVRNIAGV